MLLNPQKVVNVLHNPVTAWAILLFGLVFTSVAWYLSSKYVEQSARQRFENRANEITTAIHARMNGYEQVLWGGVGLLNAFDSTTREQWRRYVNSLSLDRQWLGIQGMGYSILLKPENLQQHIAAIRAEGFPDYDIKPKGKRTEYSAIIYLEPFDWRNKRAFGYDMWSNDMRRQAMSRSRDTGLASTSGIITLVQETKEDIQHGFLTYVPYYQKDMPLDTVQQRRRAFRAWVYAAFRMKDLMRGILGSEHTDVEYEIFDGSVISKTTLLYDSNSSFDADIDDHKLNRLVSILPLQGRKWTIVYSSGKRQLTKNEANLPSYIAIGGLIIDILLFYVITSLAFLQRRAESIAQDINAELNEAKTHLEQKIDESENLVKALTKSNEELEKFAYIASHDLQEPLRKIQTFGDRLQQKYSDTLQDKGRDYLNRMQSAAKRMRNLIDALLNFSRLGTHTDLFVPTNLHQVVCDVIQDLEITVNNSKADIQLDPLPTIDIDPTQIKQVFQNLLSNSLKFATPDQPPKITIEYLNEHSDSLSGLDTNTFCYIRFSDNGIGFDQEFDDRIFEVFQRLHDRAKYEGTGIGLAIVRRIVEHHGGTITVKSRPGKGTTIIFSLKVRHEKSIHPDR